MSNGSHPNQHHHPFHFPHLHLPCPATFTTYTFSFSSSETLCENYRCWFNRSHHDRHRYHGKLLPDTWGSVSVDVELLDSDDVTARERGLTLADKVLTRKPTLKEHVAVVPHAFTKVCETNYNFCLCERTVHKEDPVLVEEFPDESHHVVDTYPVFDVNSNSSIFSSNIDSHHNSSHPLPHSLAEFVHEASMFLTPDGASAFPAIDVVKAVTIGNVHYLTEVDIESDARMTSHGAKRKVRRDVRLKPTAPPTEGNFVTKFNVQPFGEPITAGFFGTERKKSSLLVAGSGSDVSLDVTASFESTGLNQTLMFSPVVQHHPDPPPGYSKTDPFPHFWKSKHWTYGRG